MASFHTSDQGGSSPMQGTVKWFNASKGFGFVTLPNGTDAFCHASALAAVSAPDLPPGTTVLCSVAEGQRGLQVTTVLSVDLSTAEEPAPMRGPRGMRGGMGGDRNAPSGPMSEGHVKFFNEQKGFGFVVQGDGQDVYLHASALRRSGISNLSPDQKVRFSTRPGMKGIEVDRIELV